MSRIGYVLLFLFAISNGWEIVKKVQEGKKTVKHDGVKTSITCKKVFVSLLDNGYTFRKKKTWGKRELGSFRAQFVCTECDKMDVFLSAYCSVNVLDFDEEELDEYQVQTLPTPDQHACQPSGIEQLVAEFKKSLRDGVHGNPVRPLPELYETTR